MAAWAFSVLVLMLSAWMCDLPSPSATCLASQVNAPDEDDLLWSMASCVDGVVGGTVHPSCTVLLLTDGTVHHHTLQQVVNLQQRPVAIVELPKTSWEGKGNTSLEQIGQTSRQVRQRSWCSVVVVVSESPTFLARVAEWSLKGRLLVWSTKMLAVTRLALHHLLSLLSSHWTFSMMNTVVLNLEHPRPNTRCVLYSYLPYSSDGTGMVQVVATWTPTQGLQLRSGRELFQDKFTNFHGATINITSKTFLPFWGETEIQNPDGTSGTRYTGSDYYLLETVAHTLNFTFTVLPITTWAEVTKLVEERRSFLCSLFYILMLNRAKLYDYTTVHEFAYTSFAMGRPSLRPQWQSVYYPLAGMVWVSVAASLVLCPFVLYVLSRVRRRFMGEPGYVGSLGDAVQDMVAMLLGQDFQSHIPAGTSTRIIALTWLIFALVFGAAYRGNLTAVLTLPKYPSRPETLDQLVSTAQRVTIPPFGEQHRKFYKDSDSPVYKALADMLVVGPSVMEGLKAASQVEAHLGSRRYLQQKIAESFTAVDGSTRLYVGWESLFPGPSGWPIPHDAPYKSQLDWCIRASIEAGLYEKWISDMSRQTILESQSRQRQQKSGSTEDNLVQESEGDNLLPALTITHLQGSFIILLLGLVLGALALMGEILYHKLF